MKPAKFCKWCQHEVREVCLDLACLQANRKGYCTVKCMQAYLDPQNQITEVKNDKYVA